MGTVESVELMPEQDLAMLYVIRYLSDFRGCVLRLFSCRHITRWHRRTNANAPSSALRNETDSSQPLDLQTPGLP